MNPKAKLPRYFRFPRAAFVGAFWLVGPTSRMARGAVLAEGGYSPLRRTGALSHKPSSSMTSESNILSRAECMWIGSCCTLWIEGSADGKTSVLIASIGWKPRHGLLYTEKGLDLF